MKKLAIFLALALFCCPVWAANGDMGGADPNGSEAYPYLIEDIDDFDVFAGNSNYWASGVHTKLMTDIDLAERAYTTAIIAPDTSTMQGFQGTQFQGIFNGSGYTISNLTITLPTEYYISIGLFGNVGSSAKIINLSIINTNIQGSDYIGGLAGSNSGTIIFCHARGTVSGNRTVGGLVGGNGGTISACYAAGSVICSNNTIGGLCGKNYMNGSISGSYSASDVKGGTYAGGLCGINYGTISFGYATGNVTGEGCVGGLCGYNYTLENDATISNSYAVGNVTGSNSYVGGLCGLNSGIISGSFWDIDTSGHPTSAGGTGKTTTEMMTLSTFTSPPANWDFINEAINGTNDNWMMLRENEDYPRLAWQEVFAGDIAGLYGVNEVDFALLASQWNESACNELNDWCQGADIDHLDEVDIIDLLAIADDWLKGF